MARKVAKTARIVWKSSAMRTVSAEYLAEQLVEPASLRPLAANGDILCTESGGHIPIISGVPVFSDLHPSPQWQDELAPTAEFSRRAAAELPTKPQLSLWCKPCLSNILITS